MEFAPPPEIDDDFRVNFLSQQTSSESQRSHHGNELVPPYSQLRTSGTFNQPLHSSMSVDSMVWNEESTQGYVQRVPETPSLSQSCQMVFHRAPSSAQSRLDFSFDAGSGRESIALRSISEVPDQYHGIFKTFSHFNFVQSKVFDDVMYTDNSLVTSAPTGSGKTVIFELAIVRLLMQSSGNMAAGKIIYVAPIKALCSERFEDWQAKFGTLGLRCCELTGDTQLDDYFELQNAQIVMTTPEKWDSLTRKWRDYKSLVQLVRLFLIDEVHQLNDETRGPTMEAIVSRMKTIQAARTWEEGGSRDRGNLRFIAISATIPNISDIACWLGHKDTPALDFSIDESHRPVRLRRVVLGYPDASTEFKFDLFLNYRLGGVIQLYSDQKPTLVFCATRKGTQQAAGVLVKEARFVMNGSHKQHLQQVANSFRDSKLRELVLFGVGYHHAGMDVADRKAIETMFTAGDLPVLFATSTLAMGVNLPAHLVVIKSTMHYIAGMFQECSESQILQMIGRAGRPQFDTTATAVIMTRNSTKGKYEALLSGKQLIESSLHHNLIEHLNAEVVLHTITDVSIALEWLRSTFFYIRVKQNPQHYGMPVESKEMEEELQQLCLQNLQMLESCSLVKMNDGFILEPTELGRLMARYCVAFESMKRFLSFKGKETLADLVSELSQCKEFQDVRLRVNEKRVLNTLNKDKIKPTIRFQMAGKVKSTDMKVNCLIQASLGCLPVQEFALNQDTQKIFRAASRLSKCKLMCTEGPSKKGKAFLTLEKLSLMEVQLLGENFQSLFGAVILHKCIQTRLWENSKFVSKQLDKIGLTLSTTLVNAGLTSFEKLQSTNPRELELIMNRHPPFGNQIRDAVALLPHYKLSLVQVMGLSNDRCELEVTVSLVNYMVLAEKGTTWQGTHTCMLLIGDADNSILCKQKLSDSQLLNGGKYTRKLAVCRARGGDDLKVHYISLSHVGVDAQQVFTPKYTVPPSRKPPLKPVDQSVASSSVPRNTGNGTGTYYKPCNHKCLNKAVCGHECCKNGIPVKPPKSATKGQQQAPTLLSKPPVPPTGTKLMSRAAGTTLRSDRVPTPTKPASRPSSRIGRYVDQLHARVSDLPPTPALKRIMPAYKASSHGGGNTRQKGALQDQFSYTPRPGMKYKDPTDCKSDIHSSSKMAPTVKDSENDTDDEFWSLFNDSTEEMCNAKNNSSFAIEDFDSEEPDNLDMCLGNGKSYRFQSHSSTSYQNQTASSKLQTVSNDVFQSRSPMPPLSQRLGSSVLREPPAIKKVTPFIKGRKRIIDEILDLDASYDYGNEKVLKSSEIHSSSIGWRHAATDGKCMEKGELPAVKRVPLECAQTHTDSPHKAVADIESAQHLQTVNPPMHVPLPAICSYFTAGTVDMVEEENDGDVFGSVFAGLF